MSTLKMKVGALAIATGLALLVSAGCSEVTDRSTLGPEVSLARGGNGNGGGPGGGGDADPVVDATIESGFAISDDGSGTYVTGECGVEGRIWEGGSEDVTMKPSSNWKPNLGCVKRFFVVDLTNGEDESGNPVSLGSAGTLVAMTIIDLNAVATSEGLWVRVPAQFVGDECDRLRYDSGTLPGSHVNPEGRAPWTSDDVWAVKVPHSSDPAKRAWRVQTLNPNTGVEQDLASCINPEKGTQLDGWFRVPFSVLIEEQ